MVIEIYSAWLWYSLLLLPHRLMYSLAKPEYIRFIRVCAAVCLLYAPSLPLPMPNNK